MITRFRVSGFKNLVDVDIRLGPFTCIAGLNGVGKSNLFDAIRFLSASASMTLVDAASRIRDEGGRPTDVKGLFTQSGPDCAQQMSFEIEMLTDRSAVDDLGAPAEAKANFLKYKLILNYRVQGANGHRTEGFEIAHEELTHVPKGEASKNLPFAIKSKGWQKSLLHIEHRSAPFISTDVEDGKTVIRIHQDGGSSGRPKTLASNLPRTVLSIANAAESPTTLCARRELESWMFIQLEPSSLRKADEITAPRTLSNEGEHLAATLYALASEAHASAATPEEGAAAEARVYATVANRLRELIDGVRDLRVDRDEKRDILTLEAIDETGTIYPAKALSDGTLRFLALAILEHDSSGRNVICLEEPENGIHPTRIPAMLRLLQDIATDLEEIVDATNPPRQVIINTHSPLVVRLMPEEALILAKATQYKDSNGRIRPRLQFKQLPGTWRTVGISDSPELLITKGEMLSYLGDGIPETALSISALEREGRRRAKLVAEREDMQLSLGLSYE